MTPAAAQEFNLSALLHIRLGHGEPKQLHGRGKRTQSCGTIASGSFQNGEGY